MVKSSIILSVLIGNLLFVGATLAQQPQFKKFSQKHKTVYQYIFKNTSRKHEVLKFKIDDYYLKQSRDRFSERKRRTLFAQAKDAAHSISKKLQDKYNTRLRDDYSAYLTEQGQQLPDGFKLEMNKAKAGWHLSYKGRMSRKQVQGIVKVFRKGADSWWAQLSRVARNVYQQENRKTINKAVALLYKKNRYVARRNKTNKSILEVRIDFVQVVIDETVGIRPVAKAIANKTRGLSDRQVIAYALRFLQLIPYDNLKSRDALGAIGFVAPLTLLDINKGDCDTKSAALAALIRNLLPDVRMIMGLVPEHAFLALNIPSKPDDAIINVKGLDYVVVEPTGPALSVVGQAHPLTRPYLNSRKDNNKFLLNIPSGNENNIASVF